MSGLKSVIITLPKGLVKSVNPKLNFTTSILANKTKMDIRNIPQHMDEDSTDSSLFKSDVCLRGKKRRLDHLTWEEKLQRKKLKNRVAAQTSRDRKKAKLDELEESVRILQERNEQLSRECSVLRSTNESLMVENRKLRRDKSSEVEQPVCSACQARVGCATPTSGSAAGWGSTAGTEPGKAVSDRKLDTSSQRSPEDSNPLPPLEELFAELQGDDYIDRLEELAESLLREVTAEVEANTSRSNDEAPLAEDTSTKRDDTSGMVGTTSEDVEANGTDGVAGGVTGSSVLISTEPFIPVQLKQESPDTIYGSYDEATNCITIICSDEEDVGLHEEIVTEETIADESLESKVHLSPDTCTEYTMSPQSVKSEDTGFAIKMDCSLSDCGYESHEAPSPEAPALTDLWHESFSELFPSLA